MSAELPEPAPVPLRASDADRDRYVAVLREGLASGRLTPEEYEERVDVALVARTHADLVPLVRDLPVRPGDLPGAAPVPALRDPAGAAPASGALTAVFGGIQKRGRWTVPERLPVKAVFGGAELDLTEADLADQRIELQVSAVFGGVSILVPADMRVVLDVKAVFGGSAEPKTAPSGATGPVLHVTGKAVFGGIDVKRVTD